MTDSTEQPDQDPEDPQPYRPPGTNADGSGPTENEPNAFGADKPKRQAALIFILITLFIDILGIGIIVPVLPELVKELLATERVLEDGSKVVEVDIVRAGRYVGIIGASYALMQFFFAPILGALSDRFGRRPIILGSLFGFGVDFLVQGFAPNIIWLFIGRLFAGIMGASFSTANAYIADISAPENRARNFGMVGMMFGLGFIFGPAIGGLLGEYNTRLPFFVAAGLALVNWMYGYFVLPESLSPENRSAFSLRKANPLNAPMVALANLRKYQIVGGLSIVFICTSLAQRGLENVWVLYTSFRYDWSKLDNGLALCLVGVTSAIVQGGLVRPVVKRLGERRTAIFGITVSALAFMGYGLASEGWMIPFIIVFGSLGGLAGPAIQSIVAGTVDPSDQGKVQGALTSLMSLTNIFAPVIFTAGLFSLFTASDAIIELPGAPFLTGGCLLFLALFMIIRVFGRYPEEQLADENGEAGR